MHITSSDGRSELLVVDKEALVSSVNTEVEAVKLIAEPILAAVSNNRNYIAIIVHQVIFYDLYMIRKEDKK